MAWYRCASPHAPGGATCGSATKGWCTFYSWALGCAVVGMILVLLAIVLPAYYNTERAALFCLYSCLPTTLSTERMLNAFHTSAVSVSSSSQLTRAPFLASVTLFNITAVHSTSPSYAISVDRVGPFLFDVFEWRYNLSTSGPPIRRSSASSPSPSSSSSSSSCSSPSPAATATDAVSSDQLAFYAYQDWRLRVDSALDPASLSITTIDLPYISAYQLFSDLNSTDFNSSAHQALHRACSSSSSSSSSSSPSSAQVSPYGGCPFAALSADSFLFGRTPSPILSTVNSALLHADYLPLNMSLFNSHSSACENDVAAWSHTNFGLAGQCTPVQLESLRRPVCASPYDAATSTSSSTTAPLSPRLRNIVSTDVTSFSPIGDALAWCGNDTFAGVWSDVASLRGKFRAQFPPLIAATAQSLQWWDAYFWRPRTFVPSGASQMGARSDDGSGIATMRFTLDSSSFYTGAAGAFAANTTLPAIQSSSSAMLPLRAWAMARYGMPSPLFAVDPAVADGTTGSAQLLSSSWIDVEPTFGVAVRTEFVVRLVVAVDSVLLNVSASDHSGASADRSVVLVPIVEWNMSSALDADELALLSSQIRLMSHYDVIVLILMKFFAPIGGALLLVGIYLWTRFRSILQQQEMAASHAEWQDDDTAQLLYSPPMRGTPTTNMTMTTTNMTTPSRAAAGSTAPGDSRPGSSRAARAHARVLAPLVDHGAVNG